MKEELLTYGVHVGKRYTKRQKHLLYAMMKQDWESLGYPVSLQSHDHRFYRHYNIVIGNPNSARTVFVAGYDTPPRYLINRTYAPFHPEHNQKQEKQQFLIQVMLAFFFFLMGACCIAYASSLTSMWRLSAYTLACILILLSLKSIKGWANAVNFNRSSASLALLHTIMKQHPSDCAFVLLDDTITNMQGWELFQASITNDPLVIYLDALARGETLVLAHGNHMNDQAEMLLQQLSHLSVKQRIYDSQTRTRNVLRYAKHMMVLTSGEIIKKELLVSHTGTKRDYEIDMKRITSIADALTRLAE